MTMLILYCCILSKTLTSDNTYKYDTIFSEMAHTDAQFSLYIHFDCVMERCLIFCSTKILGNWTSQGESKLPVRAEVKGRNVLGLDFHHIYDYYDFQEQVRFDDEIFEVFYYIHTIRCLSNGSI